MIDVCDRLSEVILANFRMPAKFTAVRIDPKHHLLDDLGIDDADKLTLANHVEDEFRVKLADVDLVAWTRVSDIVSIIIKKVIGP